ncbi:hypothetical protein L218DRAFT_657186 [Marasmius fiardii PR-910]|nr:hypothetical protein L218DRAFT_657186 [Marasmius fiardii PR-910]
MVFAVTVVAFKLSIVSFYDKQIRHIAIVDLLIRIQQTMVLFLRLRYLSDPEDRGDDGQTIWDRLQELLVNLTKDIEGAGRAIGAAISDGIDISSNYFQKFDGYQQALQRAFAHHPTLSEFSSAPSNPVKNDDSPKTGKHWETRIDSLISKFHAPSPDHSERPAGSPLSQTPSHPWNSSAGHPRGLQHQSALVKLGTSSRVCGGSLKTLYHSSSETSQRRSGGHLEEPTRPLLPSNSPSRRSLAGFEPSFRLTPPAAHLMDALTLDSLLSYSTAFLVDLADDTFNPTPIGPPLDVPNGTAFPSSRSHLLAPATSPPVSSIKLVLDDDDFVKPTSTIGLSQLEVRAVSSVSVRVTDVLEELYRALNHRITRSEWSQLTEKEKDHVSWEFHKRCSRSNQKQNVRDDGVKKVDFAKRTKFRCLVEAEGRKFKVMLE